LSHFGSDHGAARAAAHVATHQTPQNVRRPCSKSWPAGNYVCTFALRVLDIAAVWEQSCPLEWRKKTKNFLFVALRGAYDMSELPANDVATVSFGERLANSQAFSNLFRDGMTLVEETASYLDGPGRQESKKLDRNASLAYATESMRLTTRLMQLASWLLLHRAVKEGEMSLAQANKEKAKVKLTAADNDDNNYKVLPERLRHLIDRSRHLHDAIRRLDSTMHARPDPALIRPDDNPVERQLGLLKAAFERE
jgi:regulator of CtrA degradation